MCIKHPTHAAAIRQVQSTGLTGLLQLAGLIEVRTMKGTPRRHTENPSGTGERDRKAMRCVMDLGNQPPPRAWCAAPQLTRTCACVVYVLDHFEQDKHIEDPPSRKAACGFPSR